MACASSSLADSARSLLNTLNNMLSVGGKILRDDFPEHYTDLKAGMEAVQESLALPPDSNPLPEGLVSPLPWRLLQAPINDDELGILDAKGVTVGSAYPICSESDEKRFGRQADQEPVFHPQQIANGRLMCAAPELLRHLKMALGELDYLHEGSVEIEDSRRNCTEDLAAARALIAKLETADQAGKPPHKSGGVPRVILFEEMVALLADIAGGCAAKGRWLDEKEHECDKDEPGAHWEPYTPEENDLWLESVAKRAQSLLASIATRATTALAQTEGEAR